jgi:hypothetical protein
VAEGAIPPTPCRHNACDDESDPVVVSKHYGQSQRRSSTPRNPPQAVFFSFFFFALQLIRVEGSLEVKRGGERSRFGWSTAKKLGEGVW